MEHLTHLRTNDGSGWLGCGINSDKEGASTLKTNQSRLLKRYKDYNDLVNNFHLLPTASIFKLPDGTFSSEKEVLVAFYNIPPAALKRIFQDRRNNHCLNECPYCGQPGKPDTLDHFMPESHWPEFAIYPDNLVPQCENCARKKSNRYYSLTKSACYFIHPMYETALSQVGFEITMQIVAGIIEYKPRIHLNGSANPVIMRRIRQHIESLEIPDYIVRYCRNQHAELIDAINKANAMSAPFDFKLHCERLLESERVKAGIAEGKTMSSFPNWACAFYHALIHSSDIINFYLSQFHLPPNRPSPCVPVTSTLLYP